MSKNLEATDHVISEIKNCKDYGIMFWGKFIWTLGQHCTLWNFWIHSQENWYSGDIIMSESIWRQNESDTTNIPLFCNSSTTIELQTIFYECKWQLRYFNIIFETLKMADWIRSLVDLQNHWKCSVFSLF